MGDPVRIPARGDGFALGAELFLPASAPRVHGLAGALEWLAWRVPGVPLLWVGHSAGAQLMGLVGGAHGESRAVRRRGDGLLEGLPGLPRAIMASLWYGLLPLTLGIAGYLPMSNPLLAVSIADDKYAPPTSTAHLMSLYKRARKEQRTIRPADEPIGHFGFFRRPDLWEAPVSWLLGRVHGNVRTAR